MQASLINAVYIFMRTAFYYMRILHATFNWFYRAKQWLLNADRADLLQGNVESKESFEIWKRNLAICRQHFESKMFYNDMKQSLLSTAVPTLFKLTPCKTQRDEKSVSLNLCHKEIKPR